MNEDLIKEIEDTHFTCLGEENYTGEIDEYKLKEILIKIIERIKQ